MRSSLMALPALGVVLGLSFLSSLSPLSNGQSSQLIGPDCGNFNKNEPLLIYDVTGFTFAGGQRHTNLVVFNSGFSTLCNSDTVPFSQNAEIAFAGIDAASQLRADLSAAGAASICDQEVAGNEIPLRTVTFLRGATEARAHTYSYYVPDASTLPVQTVIENFGATHFGGFGGGGSAR